MTKSKILKTLLAGIAVMLLTSSYSDNANARASVDTSIARLQSIDKVTARTLTFEVKVGATVKFGSLYIKLQACREAPEIEEPESAAFMQVWEVSDEDTDREKANWVYSGWMFASSPGLSAMDHPIYDVWVLECKNKDSAAPAIIEGEVLEGEGVVEDKKAPDELDIQ